MPIYIAPLQEALSENRSLQKGNIMKKGSKLVEAYYNYRIENKGWSKERCKTEAGYSRNTNFREIENTALYKELEDRRGKIEKSLGMGLEERIREAQKRVGFGVEGNLRRIQEVIKRRGSEHDSAALTAIKIGTEITGERMPEQIANTVNMDERILSKLFKDGGEEEVIDGNKEGE